MEISNTALTIAFCCCVLAIGYSLYNINHFMPIEATCQDEFAMINKCGCVPCNPGLINLFNIQESCNNLTFSP